MSYEIAKLLLEHATTLDKRSDAIKTALQLGMPLHEIDAYLDWLDVTLGILQDESSMEFPPPPPGNS